MAMLADRKRREKWCINPRGKAWVDDQTKFGQRLLEKMGWSAGQGLGVNNQGPTEIVKVMKKDNTKGFGFKDNGEEWLKKTSEFNELLDELRSSGEKDVQVQETMASSLEDRSKKSKARVHYQKFTRGKDLSRYSEKDLASIIGPGVVKTKKINEGEADYTSNQVNKGSSIDYFKQMKERSVQNQALENKCEEAATNSSEEASCNTSYDKQTKLKQLEEEPDIESDTKTVGSSKKKKEGKIAHTNDLYEHQIEEKDNCDDVYNVTKKKKRKLRNKTNYDFVQSSTEFHEIVGGKKRKRNCDNEASMDLNKKVDESIVFCGSISENNDFVINNEEIPKKKRIKMQGKNESIEFSKESSLDNSNKKRNKKHKMKYDYDMLPAEPVTPPDQQKQTSKEKKKKKSDKNSVTEEILNIENKNTKMKGESESKKSKKKQKTEEKLEEKTNKVSLYVQPPLETEQMVSPENAVECLEVLGRKTRLKKIDMPQKPEKDLKYETEEFMAFTSASPKKKVNVLSQDKIIETEFKDICDTSKNTQPTKMYGLPNEQDCNIPKHVIAYEYRLLTKKLQQLNLVPSAVRVIIKDSSTLSQATHRKLKTLHKSRHLKTSLPSNDLTEIEACVKRFHEDLQPKIDMMKALDEIEEKTRTLANEMMGNSTVSRESLAAQREENRESSVDQNSNAKTLLQNLSNKLELLLKNSKGKIPSVPDNHHQSELTEPKKRKRRGKKDSMPIPFDQASGDGVLRKDSLCEENDEQLRGPCQTRIEERLALLADQIKLLKEGKIPSAFKSLGNKGMENVQGTFKNHAKHQDGNSQAQHVSNKDSNYFGGRGRRGYQRGSSHFRGISMTQASPQQRRSLRISERVDTKTQSFSFAERFESQTFSQSRGNRGMSFGRGRPGLRSSVPFGGWGAIQSFEEGSGSYNSFSDRGQGFRGRFGVGRGTFRGRGRFDLRGRGRISQNNFDAKLYAEKCRALNKVPEIAFKGVDLKIISGYAADKTVENS